MVAFLGHQGRISDALSLLDRIWDRCNSLVISQACATILEQNDNFGKEQMQQMDRILQKASKRFDQPVPLLMVAADLYEKQGRYGDAEKSFREVLRKDSSHAPAMNNLAVLLALQGVKLEESLKLVNQAIKIAGPMAAILDSRATVYLALGEPEKALVDLATDAADETPLLLFHQAQAYERTGQHDAASAALEKALQQGLAKQMLHPLELPNFEKMLKPVRKTDFSRAGRETPAKASPAAHRGL